MRRCNMLFHEIYGNYYNVIAKILTEALDDEVDAKRINRIIKDNAFGESLVTIPAKLTDKWEVLDEDNHPLIYNIPQMPLTLLQKRWLKSICMDKRIKLFSPDEKGLEDVEPLFNAEYIVYYDNNADSDPYENESYINNFHLILDAVKDLATIKVNYLSRRMIESEIICIPQFLEYSQKDDKFRVQVELIDSPDDKPAFMMLNLSRIVSCDYCDEEAYESTEESKPHPFWTPVGEKRSTVTVNIYDERNSLERALLTFSHLERNTKRLDENTYQMKITYDTTDETELLINLLSFGPTVKIIGPNDFIEKITCRLKQQNSVPDSETE